MNLTYSKNVELIDTIRNLKFAVLQRIFESENIRKDRMKIIVVSGSRSGVGKTYVVQRLLSYLTNWSALKVTVVRKSHCPHQNNCQICANFEADYDIVTDKKIINQRCTDTSRLKQAGAKKVIWLKSTLKSLKFALKNALKELKNSRGIIIEGTSVLKYIKPNLSIFINDNKSHLRTAAKQALNRSDIIFEIRKSR